MLKTILTWDLGATKCTAGIIEFEPATHTLTCIKNVTIKLAETTSLTDLINKLELSLGLAMPDADAICIGAAGHYDGQYLLHTNAYPYLMNFAEIAESQHWPAFTVVHDYAPIVCATFTSSMEQSSNIKRLNTCPLKKYGRRVAFGLGTGLGLKDGVLFPNGDFWLGQNEMGHIGIGLPPHTDARHLNLHAELMNFFQLNYGLDPAGITLERILTGKGTANLHEFFYPQLGRLSPEEVGERMRNYQTPELLHTLAWYTGLFVGTVQLTFMPEGGVWITGGVIMNHLDIFDSPEFLAGVVASPAYLMQREEYPIGILCNPELALIGSGYYAAKRLLC